ncbi:molecular chaperone Hsp33 [Seinonella peptonophila]|uniref:33 kDa chaperonin n=1 Tax=Seinonella peptonophila TaxID=112248 RepID=A0A1M4YSE4_9BACL|nr:Hsp33 family molecular chaperone HslO [Seinonella peptonophila]SHF08633.1 molecular chaperone Hsp33 [Seinonella peptonophila]
MSSYIVRAIARNGEVRAFAAETRSLVQEAVNRHLTFPVASAALGRTLTMGAIWSAILKEEQEVVTIRVEGDGPLGKVIVHANGAGEVRGLVDEPQIEVPNYPDGKLNVAAAVGQGMIHISKDIGLREPYQGSSPIVSGELAEDFTYYFTTSEQTPSSVGLGILVQREQILQAGGYLLQVLPQATDETISRLEERISQLTSITDFYQQGGSPEKLLEHILGENLNFLSQTEVTFSCRCSNESVANMLRSLGKKEIQSIIDEIGYAEVTCHFCNEKYHFDQTQLLQLIDQP